MPVPLRELQTARLRLRSPVPEDAADYFTYLFGCPEVGKYMLWAPHKDPEESRISIRKALDRCREGTAYRWVITSREDRKLLGLMDLVRIDREAGCCSFVYMLGIPYQGQGYGSEALKAALDFAFTDLKLQRVTADHMAENPASGRAMEKAGMIRTGFHKAKYEKNGICHDAAEYTITRSQWMQNREQNLSDA